MCSFLFENTDEDPASGLKLLEAHRYWSKKRILFNIIVGTGGIISVLLFPGAEVTLFDLFGMVLWGIVANGLYSTGYVLDSYIISQSKGERSLQDNRDILFWIGTIAYVIVGFLFVMVYSFPLPAQH